MRLMPNESIAFTIFGYGLYLEATKTQHLTNKCDQNAMRFGIFNVFLLPSNIYK